MARTSIFYPRLSSVAHRHPLRHTHTHTHRFKIIIVFKVKADTIGSIKTRFCVGPMTHSPRDECFPNPLILLKHNNMNYISANIININKCNILNEPSLSNSRMKWNSHTCYALVSSLLNWNMRDFFIYSLLKSAYCPSQLVSITKIKNDVNYTKLS